MSWWLLAAIACSIIASQVLGMLWYGPLFGKIWMKEMGLDKLTKKQWEAKQKEAIPGYIASAVLGGAATALLWVILFEWDIHGLAMSDLSACGAGALFGFMTFIIGYVPGTYTGRFFEDRSNVHWLIGAGYWGILAVLWGTFAGVFSTL